MNSISRIRKTQGVSQKEVASRIGVTQSQYSRYESGSTNIPGDMLKKLAEYFGVTVDELLNEKAEHTLEWAKDGLKPADPLSSETVRVPILGRVRAGYDSYADQELLGYMEIEKYVSDRFPGCFALKVTGDSMEPEIHPGDTVICAPCAEVSSGSVAVVCINGDEGTLKRVKITPDGLALIPNNPKYGTMRFSKNDVETLPVTICARAIEVRRSLL